MVLWRGSHSLALLRFVLVSWGENHSLALRACIVRACIVFERVAALCSSVALFVHSDVTVVASHVDHSIGDGVLDGALSLVAVRTICEFAAVDKRPDIAKASSQFFSCDVPELKLADAWSINDVPATFDRNQHGRSRRVSPFFAIRADVAGAKIQVRIDGV